MLKDVCFYSLNGADNEAEAELIKVLYGDCNIERLQEGIYISNNAGLDNIIVRELVKDTFPELIDSSYGVCDSPEQFLECYKDVLDNPERNYAVYLTPIKKKDQPSEGGWRWHKWGRYIGKQKREGHEYLYDEPNIELVYAYHIVELHTEFSYDFVVELCNMVLMHGEG